MEKYSKSTEPMELAFFGRVLKPLVRFAVARRLSIQVMVDILKRLYISVSQEEFSLPSKRLTDSRISLLTGLQRKDIKAIRNSDEQLVKVASSSGILPRIVAAWQNEPDYQDEDGKPLPLQKLGKSPSFEALVAMISQDTHPRTALDDLMDQGHVVVDEAGVQLSVVSFIPSSDEKALIGYLENNLGDHAEAAITNVMQAPEPPLFFERAVHYNRLTNDSLLELDELSRKLQQEALEVINARAYEFQQKDKSSPDATGRFRCGVFIYKTGPETKSHEE